MSSLIKNMPESMINDIAEYANFMMSKEQMSKQAILSSHGEYSSFAYGDRRITFYTGKNLERYTRVIEWDHGYIVVMCLTKSQPDREEEDYIDLLPILDNLYIDADKFLNPIEEVEIQYA